MELETLICQNCGQKAKPEAGRGVICPCCGILSGLLRPDDAYLEKKPLFKTRVAQGTLQFVLGAIASAIASGILATPLCRFFDSFV